MTEHNPSLSIEPDGKKLSDGDALSRVTILIHTANRPEQLVRLMRYYATQPMIERLSIVIADGSTPEHRARFEKLMLQTDIDLDYTMLPGIADEPFLNRLVRAIGTVETELMMLAADDDFYFSDWISHAVRIMIERRDLSAMIGNYLVFEIGRFAAFSNEVKVIDGGPERFQIPWLEGKAASSRVRELGANPHGIQIMTWYALHRTEVIAGIISHGARYDLPLLLFERYFAVAQAASGKTHFTQEIFLARQADIEPMCFATYQAAIPKLESCTRAYLHDVLGIEQAKADKLIAVAYEHEINMMQQADRRRGLRRLANGSPIRRWLTAWRMTKACPPRDARLPQGCDLMELEKRGAEIKFACRPV
jgi:glycosyltransferase domain-containing protein